MIVDKIQRYPRGAGITELARIANSDSENANKARESLTRVAIQTWLMGNGMLWGKNYTMSELSVFLKCEPVIIQDQMRDQLFDNRMFNKEHIDKILESMTGAIIGMAIEDRMEASQQLGILKASQGNHYVPFISSEVGKMLTVKQSTTNNLHSILRTLSGAGTPNIFNQFNQQNNIEVHEVGITKVEALDFIQKQMSSIDRSKELEYIEAHYDFQDLPEVVANKQEGIDTSKEGLSIKKTELEAITADYHGVKDIFEEEHHEIRREIMENIDRDAEDPEIATILPG